MLSFSLVCTRDSWEVLFIRNLNLKFITVVSGLSFFTLQLWDSRKKGVLQTFQNTYQVTAVTFSDTAEQIISGGIDNDVKVSKIP